MDGTMVDQVRRFNRAVVQRVGALDDGFLGTGRPVAEARLLWEVGPDGCEVRALRARLDLDSGYLSRLLRALEADGLVRMGRHPGDTRVGTVSLTAAGRRERAKLDRRSDGVAESFLAPLTTRQRERLVAAMGDVERLLTASLVELREVDPEHPDARQCLRAYFAELARRAQPDRDPSTSLAVEPDAVRPPAGVMLVAYLRSEPVGCGAVKLHGAEPAELKRMWVADAVRGLGLGRRLLETLEAWAAEHGAPAVRLDTNKALVEAIAMYRSAGYVDVPAFTAEPFAHHWFEKPLPVARA
jgi:DNA-binding MarR family transcriptional regulator/GNAT superfamily N-acetyltransferase